MTLDAYKQALEQAKKELAEAVEEIGKAEEAVIRGNQQSAEFRQTIAVLSKLCKEPEFVEEDALGLTDVVRLAYQSMGSGKPATPQDIKSRIDSRGYAGRWGNLLASVYTVSKRLVKKGELQDAGKINNI